MNNKNLHPSLYEIAYRQSEDTDLVARTANGLLLLVLEGNSIVQEFGTASDPKAFARQQRRVTLLAAAREIAQDLDSAAPIEPGEDDQPRSWYSTVSNVSAERAILRNGQIVAGTPPIPELSVDHTTVSPFILEIAGFTPPDQPTA